MVIAQPLCFKDVVEVGSHQRCHHVAANLAKNKRLAYNSLPHTLLFVRHHHCISAAKKQKVNHRHCLFLFSILSESLFVMIML